ncbi:MAG: EAL domain-containing protein [Rhodocyclaceae bacterium]|nr:EAL domain-containing protein [Rhodocyclaceae bacterium]
MPLRVLLVEDDFGDAALVEIFLNEAWVGNPPEVRHVICVSDAKLELARERFDIVICDLSLPDAEGVDTVIELRDSSRGAPIVVLTGRDDPEFSLSLIERGAQDYLNKRELNAANLMRAIRYAIERDRQAAQLRMAMRIEQLRREILVRIAEDSPVRDTLGEIGTFMLREAGCSAYLFTIDRQDEFERAEAGDLRWSDGAQAAGGTPPESGARLYAIATSSGQVLGSLAVRLPEHGGSEALSVCVQHATELAALAIERNRIHREQKLAAMMFRAAGQAIIITNAALDVVSVNPAFCRLLGYSEEAVLGRRPSLFVPGVHDEGFHGELWRRLQHDGQWAGEIVDRRANGELITFLASINAVCGLNGLVERYVCLLSDISDRKQFEETISRYANFDPLTCLPNRRLFMDRMAQEILRSRRSNVGFALLFIDLDRFKDVNDTLGHYMGDLLLQQTAERLLESVRATDTVARLGGDEFTILLTGINDRQDVEKLAPQILAALNEPFDLQGEHVLGGASIGITLYPHDAVSEDVLFKHADQAMYRAKQEGRGRYCYFTSDMQEAAEGRMRMHQDLLAAVRQSQFELFYQPIVTPAGATAKFEALLRWRHPQRGLVLPGQFIGMVEEIGLIKKLGDWVLQTALQQLKAWDAGGHVGMKASINKSPRQFGQRADDSKEWLAMIRDHGIDPRRIIIEITEGVLLDERPHVTEQIRRYRDAGVGIAVDDFGTGYSALSYLKRLPIDFVKIDRSFIADLVDDINDRNLVEAIIVMCHKLGMQVVAEGVENLAQRGLLQGMGCDYMQGYLFGRPEPGGHFLASPRGQPGDSLRG